MDHKTELFAKLNFFRQANPQLQIHGKKFKTMIKALTLDYMLELPAEATIDAAEILDAYREFADDLSIEIADTFKEKLETTLELKSRRRYGR